jgi:hypothetical protein
MSTSLGFRTRTAIAALGALAFIAAPTTAQTFCEQGGLLMFEVENSNPNGGWVEETSSGGFSGDSYFRWNGGNQFQNPGLGVLSYTFEITNPGNYNFRIRNRHNDPDATMENDCWTRVDGGDWDKSYSKFNNVWTWNTRFDPEGGAADYDAEYFLTAGTHTLQISGRSQNFRIDRVHFYLDGTPDPENINLPESECVTSGWFDLGNGLAGTNGEPTLSGDGPQTGGSLTTLSVDDGLPNGQAYLVLGLDLLNAPFKGGVLVPDDDVVLGPLPLDGNGDIDIQWTWAALPAGTSLFWQMWIPDAGGPVGFAATNALESITP